MNRTNRKLKHYSCTETQNWREMVVVQKLYDDKETSLLDCFASSVRCPFKFDWSLVPIESKKPNIGGQMTTIAKH